MNRCEGNWEGWGLPASSSQARLDFWRVGNQKSGMRNSISSQTDSCCVLRSVSGLWIPWSRAFVSARVDWTCGLGQPSTCPPLLSPVRHRLRLRRMPGTRRRGRRVVPPLGGTQERQAGPPDTSPSAAGLSAPNVELPTMPPCPTSSLLTAL